jgi:hypothetical protein
MSKVSTLLTRSSFSMAEIANYYCQGSILSLKLDTGTVLATIMQPLTPFTSSQVLLVLLGGVRTIMKVYDPRFLCHRQRSKYRPARPWDCQIEAETIRQTTPDPDFDFISGMQRPRRMGDIVLSANGMQFSERGRIVQVSRSLAGVRNSLLLWVWPPRSCKSCLFPPRSSSPIYPRRS